MVLSGNVHRDLIAEARLSYNRDFSVCLLPSSQDVDGTRVQWNVERREPNAGSRRQFIITTPNATDDSPVFRLGVPNPSSAGLKSEKRFRTAFKSDKRMWRATRPTYTVGRADRKHEESNHGRDYKVGANCKEERLAKSFPGNLGPSLLNHG